MNKSKFTIFIDMFTKLSTAIFLFSSLYILFFAGMNGTISLKYIWGVLIISGILSLVRTVIFPEKELPKIPFLLINLGYAIFCNIVVIVVGLWLNWFSLNNPKTIIGIEIIFIIIFAIMWIYSYLSVARSTQKMNELLTKIKNTEKTSD